MRCAHRASQTLIQYEKVAHELIRHDHKGNKGDDGLMRYTHIASWPPIQCDVVDEDGLMRCEYKGNKGDH
eukprot:12653666-Ditylum_brightwellii.AAC.1